MFTRFARPIDLRQVRTPRPLGVGIGSIGFPDNELGGFGVYGPTLEEAAAPAASATPTYGPTLPEWIAALSDKTTPAAPAAPTTPSMTGQDWAQIIGASTAGLLNVVGSYFQVEAARKAAKEREWALENIITAGGAVAPAAGVGIGMGTLALIAGGGFVVYMLVRRKK